ncbi:DUF6929 family protein [Adhaeribacter terreus]|uniref:DUF6929 family protein n=1 Tax=Adhaeribacter terreus TaxID=529703 RepID=A0ABW0ECA5_9BACT
MAKPVSENGVSFSMNPKHLLFAAITLAFLSCQSENKSRETKSAATATTASGKMKAIVEKAIELDSIPSGSGLVKTGENFYLISDDSPYFFRLDSKFNLLEKNAIPHYQKSQDYRIQKAIKPDYESAATGEMNGQEYLLAFGSGSKSPERDSLLLINLNDLKSPQTYSLKPLYDLIKQQANLPSAELNMEGSAIIGEELYLFNRGQNVLVQTNWPKTLLFLTQKAAEPEIKTYRVRLPQINGIAPGFSGACRLGNDNKILFTASVENTKNWIEDGEILGSFIGILDVEKLAEDPLENVALLTNKNGEPVIEKVESVEFLQLENNGNLKALCLTDDDQGGSKVLEVTLRQST